jgi:hypothetical protein
VKRLLSTTVSVLLLTVAHASAQTFTGPETLPGVGAAFSSDFNGDGRSDFVTVNGGIVQVLLRAADNSFVALPAQGTNCSGNTQIGDVNRDGIPDIVIAGFLEFCMLRGNGDGTFAELTPVQTGIRNNIQEFVLADVIGDSALDAIFIGEDDHTHAPMVVVAPSVGAGIVTVVTEPEDIRLQKVGAGDLNGDGRADIVYIRESNVTSLVRVRSVLSTGSAFVAHQDLQPQSFFGIAISVTDVTGDGLADLVVDRGNPVVYVNDAGMLRSTEIVSSASTAGLHLVDVNRDGRLDILARSGSSLGFAPGLGDGGFGVVAQWAIPQTDFAAVAFDSSNLLNVLVPGGGNANLYREVSPITVDAGDNQTLQADNFNNVAVTVSGQITTGNSTDLEWRNGAAVIGNTASITINLPAGVHVLTFAARLNGIEASDTVTISIAMPESLRGPEGPMGPQGEKGDTGATGATGAQGPQGEQGPKGDKGDTGAQGPQGPAGSSDLPPGTMILLPQGAAAPSGWSYVGTFQQTLSRGAGPAVKVTLDLYRKN